MAKRKAVSAVILMLDARGRILQACTIRHAKEGGHLGLGWWEGSGGRNGRKEVHGVEVAPLALHGALVVTKGVP